MYHEAPIYCKMIEYYYLLLFIIIIYYYLLLFITIGCYLLLLKFIITKNYTVSYIHQRKND